MALTGYRNPLQACINQAKQNTAKTTIADVYRLLPKDDVRRMVHAVNACIFAIDIFDTYARCISSIAQKSLNGKTLQVFTEVRQAIEQCERTLGAAHHKTDTDSHQLFAEEAERIEKYIDKRMNIFGNKKRRLANKKQRKTNNQN